MRVLAMIHSKEKIEHVWILEKRDKDYLVKTEDGVICTAIYNIFTDLYYADDKYGVIEKEDTNESRHHN